MKCKNCGAEIIENARFCGNCGTLVETVAEDTSVEDIIDIIKSSDSSNNTSEVMNMPVELMDPSTISNIEKDEILENKYELSEDTEEANDFNNVASEEINNVENTNEFVTEEDGNNLNELDKVDSLEYKNSLSDNEMDQTEEVNLEKTEEFQPISQIEKEDVVTETVPLQESYVEIEPVVSTLPLQTEFTSEPVVQTESEVKTVSKQTKDCAKTALILCELNLVLTALILVVVTVILMLTI